MAFVSQLLSIPRLPSNRHTAFCAAKSPKPTHKKKPTQSPLIDDTSGSNYLRSLHRECDPELIGKKIAPATTAHCHTDPSQKDVWDTLIDDRTVVEDMIHVPDNASPDILPTVECGQARMAVRPSDSPKPEMTAIPEEQNATPKKRRGRPKGSKSKKASERSPAPISPLLSAVREDLRRRNMAARSDSKSGASDAQSKDGINWDQVELRAPNGLPDEANDDLLQELLPILSQQESEDSRIIPEEERRVKQLISACCNQFSSTHRSSDRLNNLKPFKLRAKAEEDCSACKGIGMTVCEYCDGQGFVDLGENGEKFNPKFGDNEFTMPKHVMGNIYHCPLCGGLQKERCTSCLGTGTLFDAEEVMSGASSVPKDNRAWKVFDIDELMRREADRIEVGLDGTIIMRAKKRGRRRKATSKEDDKKTPVSRGRRGRKSKTIPKEFNIAARWDESTEPADVAEDGADLTSDLQRLAPETSAPFSEEGDEDLITTPGTVAVPRGRPVVRTTDFVNTTDYQVGRRLQRRPPAIRQDFTEPPSVNSPGAQE